MAHPELNVESSILKWPADQIKTGRIQVKDSNTGFVNYDTLYIKIPESIDSRIIWSDNQNINQKYKIHHSLVGDKKVDNRIIAIYNDNKKDMVVNPLLMNGLANFEDIGINGILIDFEFSFDNNGNYTLISESLLRDGKMSVAIGSFRIDYDYENLKSLGNTVSYGDLYFYIERARSLRAYK